MQETLKKHADKLRFGAVGIANTSIDFGILFLLVNLFSVSMYFSNFCSTSIAFVFSFFANKHYTFKSSGEAKQEIFKFAVVTLFGLWVLQPLILKLVNLLLINSIDNSNVVLLIGKLLATIITLIWNYILYKKFVFNNN